MEDQPLESLMEQLESLREEFDIFKQRPSVLPIVDNIMNSANLDLSEL